MDKDLNFKKFSSDKNTPDKPRCRPSKRDSGYQTDSPASVSGTSHFFARDGSPCRSIGCNTSANNDFEASTDIEDIDDSSPVLFHDQDDLDIDPTDPMNLQPESSHELTESTEEVFEPGNQETPPTSDPIQIPQSNQFLLHRNPFSISQMSQSPEVIPMVGLGRVHRIPHRYSTGCLQGALVPHQAVDGSSVSTQTSSPCAQIVSHAVRAARDPSAADEEVDHGDDDGVTYRRLSFRGTAARRLAADMRPEEDAQLQTVREGGQLEQLPDEVPGTPHRGAMTGRGVRSASMSDFNSNRPGSGSELRDMGRELRRISDEFQLSYRGTDAHQLTRSYRSEATSPSHPASVPTRGRRFLSFLRPGTSYGKSSHSYPDHQHKPH